MIISADWTTVDFDAMESDSRQNKGSGDTNLACNGMEGNNIASKIPKVSQVPQFMSNHSTLDMTNEEVEAGTRENVAFIRDNGDSDNEDPGHNAKTQ